MAEAIEYEQFDHKSEPGADAGSDTDLSRLAAIPMELSVEIGRTHMTVGETLDLGVGSVVTLERLAGETADLLVNGSAIARGEVVVIDEQYGLRVTEILDRQQDGEPVAVTAVPTGTANGAGAGAGAGAGGGAAQGAPEAAPQDNAQDEQASAGTDSSVTTKDEAKDEAAASEA